MRAGSSLFGGSEQGKARQGKAAGAIRTIHEWWGKKTKKRRRRRIKGRGENGRKIKKMDKTQGNFNLFSS